MPRIIAQLNGFDRYPWVTTAYLLTSTISVPIFDSILLVADALLIAAVVRSVAAGQIIGKTGRYRSLAISGTVLATAGMFLMAAMDGRTLLKAKSSAI